MNNKKDIEEKFFDLSVRGVLADRKKIALVYKSEIPKNKSIIEFFIEKEEKCTEDDIKNWKEKYDKEMARIRSLATRERIKGFGSRDKFLKWYLNKYHNERKCCYCGVKEEDLVKYFGKIIHKRDRGKYLEIERFRASGDSNQYNEKNTGLACFICNNAKSDFLSPKKFKPIAKGINNFWNMVLAQEKNGNNKETIVEFDENSKVWDIE